MQIILCVQNIDNVLALLVAIVDKLPVFK